MKGADFELDEKERNLALTEEGISKAERIMKELQIAESRRIRGIGERQREALLARLSK